jgi:hypothetical protein
MQRRFPNIVLRLSWLLELVLQPATPNASFNFTKGTIRTIFRRVKIRMFLAYLFTPARRAVKCAGDAGLYKQENCSENYSSASESSFRMLPEDLAGSPRQQRITLTIAH